MVLHETLLTKKKEQGDTCHIYMEIDRAGHDGNEEIIKLVVVSQSRSFENNFKYFRWRPLKHFVGEECRNKIVAGITKYPQPMNKLPMKF